MTIAGKSQSTLTNYARYVAKIALHFDCLPTHINTDQLNDYLYFISKQHNTPSKAYFKFTVFGLRYVFRMENMEEKYVALPVMKRDYKLPVVLSRQESKRLLDTPKQPKHKIILGLLYGCGLRCSELCNLKIADLDFDRYTLHVRQGKYKKDRYVPMPRFLIEDLKSYIKTTQSQIWLFPLRSGSGLTQTSELCHSRRGIQWIVSQAKRKASIAKQVSTHTLRHSYATHLLEDGLDILSIKELLGHERIETTMVYLHIAQLDILRSFSPLDTLYGLRKSPVSNESVNTIYADFYKLAVYTKAAEFNYCSN